ncbi:hypothetical protein AAFF_G00324010, partial [Aldrovandia affinis]
ECVCIYTHTHSHTQTHTHTHLLLTLRPAHCCPAVCWRPLQVYENWRENQPDNFFAGGEDCVVMVARERGRWNDVPCNYNLPSLCKKPSVLCGPPPSVDNAFLIGRELPLYEVHSVVRYQCADGFHQRHAATAKCRASGSWDTPTMVCTKSRRPHRYRRHHHQSRRDRRRNNRHAPAGRQGDAEGHTLL